MGKIALLKTQSTIGDAISLRLSRGDDLRGVISQFGDDYVCLLIGGRNATIFEDLVAGWEIIQQVGDLKDSTDHNLTIPRIALSPVLSESTVPSNTTAAPIATEISEVVSTISEATKYVQLNWQDLPIDFQPSDFPPAQLEAVKRDWGKARNQYDYAIKIRELSRLNDTLTRILLPLRDKYPTSVSLCGFSAMAFVKLGRTQEAVEELRSAVLDSPSPAYWRALACVSERYSASQCFALRNYFLLADPLSSLDDWHFYLGCAQKTKDFAGIQQILAHWYKTASEEKCREITNRAAIFCAHSLHAPLAANEIWQLRNSLCGEMTDLLKDVIRSSEVPVTAELATVEAEFSAETRAKQAKRASKSQINAASLGGSYQLVPVSEGSVLSFGNRGFGFLRSRDKQQIFFHLNNVVDNELYQALLDDTWRTNPYVIFNLIPAAPGYKYPRATDVATRRQAIAIKGDVSPNASHVHVRNTQSLPPVSSLPTSLRKPTQTYGNRPQEYPNRNTVAPKGQDAYSKGKRAQLVEGNFADAERYFREAILADHHKKESAVKDLASLLQQHGRTDEALEILSAHRNALPAPTPYDNMLATMLQHHGRYDDCIAVLQGIAAAAPRSSTSANIWRRMAVCHLKMGRYEQAEATFRELLKWMPSNDTARRWLHDLEEAKRTGIYSSVDEGIDELSQEGVALSRLAEDAIQSCPFEGVSPAQLEEGRFSLKDVEKLENLARTLGAQRPRDRSSYFLSAAAILERFIRDEQHTARTHRDLRRYFASMGDSAWVDKKPIDVIRNYYIESISLLSKIPSEDEIEEWLTLIQFYATFAPERLRELKDALFDKGSRSTRRNLDVLSMAITAAQARVGATVWLAVVELCTRSHFAEKTLWDLLRNAAEVREALNTWLGLSADATYVEMTATWKERCSSHKRIRTRVFEECTSLTRFQLATANMEELSDRLDKLASDCHWDLDRRRARDLSEIVQAALSFCRATDFEEKEQQYWLVNTRAQSLIDGIVAEPTRLSYAGLRQVGEHLRSLIEEDYAQLILSSAPTLTVRLLVDHYFCELDGEVRLKLEISNKPGCSPASSLAARVAPVDSQYFVLGRTDWEIASALRGGAVCVGEIVVRPTPVALSDQVFPISIKILYQNRMGEACESDALDFTVRLYPDWDFKELPNPYAPYAEGGAVDNREMFVGRDEVVSQLAEALLGGTGTKSFVVFGQKRAGKSSLLTFLKIHLLELGNCVPVMFSCQEIAPELNECYFLYKILWQLADVMQDMRLEGADLPILQPPTLEEMRTHPTLRFHETMSTLNRQLREKRDRGDRSTIVLLVDEFTDIYKGIRNKTINPLFMKAWKSIIEKRYFSSVLVGQDIMPAFKNEFANEFGVTESIRISYLSDADARELVTRPIGGSRFAGTAIDRVIALTAGSPYYTMMFCNRLVNYMNRTRSTIVTEVDIAGVEKDMIVGDARLDGDKFDNLITAGDGIADTGIDPVETRNLCVYIAENTERGWFSVDKLCGPGLDQSDVLLRDLVTRDVLTKEGSRYRIKVGLFESWLKVHG